MVSFNYCKTLNDFTKLSPKDEDALYFVKNHGVYRGSTLCTSDHTEVIEGILTQVGNLISALEEELGALQTKDKELEGAIQAKLNKANHATSTGTFIMGATSGSGTAQFQYDGNALTITLS
jgi:hypothetical protein